MSCFNGTAKFKDADRYIAWYQSLSFDDAKTFLKATEKFTTGDRRASLPSYTPLNAMFSFNGIQCDEAWEKHRNETTEKIKRFISFAVDFEQPLNVGQSEDGVFSFLYLGNPNDGIIVPEPEKYLDVVPGKDFSDMTPAQVRMALGAEKAPAEMALVPAEAEQLTAASIKETLSGNKASIDALENEMDNVRKNKTSGLAEIQAQMDKLKAELDAKKEKLMAELNQKKAEMEAMKEQLEGQIYLLDSQIYAIQCYAGEVVKFARIRSGKNAPSSEPIVIYQKLRFLDEDLALLASIYSIDWREMDMFESFLKNSPLALDTFAPNERCVMLVRLSRSGKRIAEFDELPCQNLLQSYEYFHGRTVGIIIRNGENLYLGWTDEERVHIDDDLIISQVINIDSEPMEEKEFVFASDRERYISEQKEQRKRLLDGLISRSFIYNILQGIVDHSNILPLPVGVKLSKQSEYVVYSVADKWLTDNKYGGFTDIVKRCNETVQKGDMLLTVQHLVPERSAFSPSHTWENTRGRGERNRTHDCSVDDCTLYPANLVEYDTPVPMIRYRWKKEPDWWELKKNPDLKPYWAESVTEKKSAETLMPVDAEIIEEYDEKTRHVFVSIEKTDTWYYGRTSDKLARANFELIESEYINLTYINSVWLEYVITNKSLGGWRIANKAVDYAYAIRYLKTALDFIRSREANEKTLLDAVDPSICKDSDWPLKLSEWKMKMGVRNITEFQAKRFAKEWSPNAAV